MCVIKLVDDEVSFEWKTHFASAIKWSTDNCGKYATKKLYQH